MASPHEKLDSLVKKLPRGEAKICSALGGLILGLGDIDVMEQNETHDLAFKALDRKFKPSFATFITYTFKRNGSWNKNTSPDSLVVQIKYKGVKDMSEIPNPKKWPFFVFKKIDIQKGWYSFRVANSEPETIDYAFKLVKGAHDSL